MDTLGDEGSMHAAIYARKSTEQTGVADEARSVTRQIEHAKTYALKNGWTILDELIFVDDGISGAEFERRPGFQRLLASLKHRPPFQFLVVMDESRLGRESIEVSSLLKQISIAGVVTHCYLDGKAVQLDTPTDKVMLALRGFTDESERTRGAQRTHDAMMRKALMGHVTGGRVYGYDNIEILSGLLDAYGRPKRDHVERKINTEQAEVVRRIFRLCAAGKGMISIARLLNDEGYPAPRNSQGRKISWSPSSVRSLLFRRLYLGEVVWNKTKKRNLWGKQQQKKRPEKDWVKIPLPQLLIVSEAEWKAAHDRLNATRAVYLRGTKGELWGRPASTLDSKYLLTGLVKCGLCGGSVYVKSSSRKGTRALFYGCMTHHLRGRAECANTLLTPMDRANEEVLTVLERDVLHPDVTKAIVRKALDKFRASEREWTDRRQALHKQITTVDTEIKRLVSAISAGGDIPALVEAVKAANDRRETLSQELAQVDSQQHSDADYDQLEKELQAHFEACWKTVLTRQVGPTRQILRKLFNGDRLPFRPMTNESGSQYEFKGTALIGRLLTGRAKGLVSPTGFEPVLLP
jgi:DNA invertase Pin-like site-specific DNA recombinase